jgi:hypothetical protein
MRGWKGITIQFIAWRMGPVAEATGSVLRWD